MTVHAPGRPYAPVRDLPISMSYATVGRRLLAQVLDTAAVLAMPVAVLILWPNYVLATVILVELLAAQVVSQARCGATLGQWIVGVRTARLSSVYAPGLWWALARALLLGAAHLVAGVGQFLLTITALRDPRRQGWHDRAVRTTVVDVRADTVGAPEFSGTTSARGATAASAADSGPSQEAQAQQAAVPAAGEATFAPESKPVTPTFQLQAENGAVIAVQGAVLLGRAPAEAQDARPIALNDPHRSLSRIHARIEIDHGCLVVTDLGSSNGTFIHTPEGQVQQLAARTPMTVPVGHSISLGSRTLVIDRG